MQALRSYEGTNCDKWACLSTIAKKDMETINGKVIRKSAKGQTKLKHLTKEAKRGVRKRDASLGKPTKKKFMNVLIKF